MVNFKKVLSTITILANLILHFQSKLIKENVVMAINCGGDEYVDEDGIVYEKVNFFE
jgi:hypothetical protein